VNISGPFCWRRAPRLCYTYSYTLKCVSCLMATNLDLDDRLVEEARRVGRHKTKREAVTAALDEYIAHRKQLQLLRLFGTVEYDPKYDYKREGRAKR
jgi:Arc/MetJ family transcription regulator